MDAMAFRILDTLARTLGDSLSIRALAKRVEEIHGTGPYPNVYREVQQLEQAGLIHLTRGARVHTVTLDIARSRDALAQRDLQRLQVFGEAHPRFYQRVEALHEALFRHDAAGVLIDPERGVKANRLQLMVLAREDHAAILESVAQVARHHQMPIDAAPLTPDDLARLADARAWNPIPDWIRTGIAFHDPQAIWQALQDRRWAAPESGPTLEEVQAALGTLGHRELGSPKSSRPVGVEEAATQLVATGEARRLGAAAVILAKNKPVPGLLHGLALRRGIGSEILSLLRLARPGEPTIALLEASGVADASLDEAYIQSTLDDA